MRGDGKLSTIKKIVTGGRPSSPPVPQSIALLNENNPISAKIEWLPPKHTYGLPIRKYLLWYKPMNTDSYEQAEVGGDETSFVLKNLRNFFSELIFGEMCLFCGRTLFDKILF